MMKTHVVLAIVLCIFILAGLTVFLVIYLTRLVRVLYYTIIIKKTPKMRIDLDIYFFINLIICYIDIIVIILYIDIIISFVSLLYIDTEG